MKTISLAKKLVAGVVSVAIVASMAVITAVTSFAADGEFSLSVDKSTAKPGDEIIATVNVDNLEFSSAQFDIEYDTDALEFVRLRMASNVRGEPTFNNDAEAGVVRFAFAINFNQVVDGAYVNVTFRVKEDVAVQSSVIKFTNLAAIATAGRDEDGNLVGDGSSVSIEPAVGVTEAVVEFEGIVIPEPDSYIRLAVDTTSQVQDGAVVATVNMKEFTYGSLMLNVDYDASVLEFVGYTFSDDVAYGIANDVGGTVKISAAAADNVTINGAFITLNFKVKEDAEIGATGELKLTVTEAILDDGADGVVITDDAAALVDQATASVTVIGGGESSDTPSVDDPSSDTPSEDNPSSDTPSDGGNTSSGSNSGITSSGSGSGSGSPSTGDAAPIAVIALLGVIALAGVVIFAKKGLSE